MILGFQLLWLASGIICSIFSVNPYTIMSPMHNPLSNDDITKEEDRKKGAFGNLCKAVFEYPNGKPGDCMLPYCEWCFQSTFRIAKSKIIQGLL
ncbi:hypothetical protein ACE6H2_008107 [Prunus campanulata]